MKLLTRINSNQHIILALTSFIIYIFLNSLILLLVYI